LNGYPAGRTRALAETAPQRIASIPGVRSAAVGVNLVVSGNVDMSTVETVAGYRQKEDEDMNAYVDSVGPGYFSTMGIPLLRGREFTASDRAGAPRVAIVSEAFAKYYFKDEDPIGRRFAFFRDKGKMREIVGVVRGSKYEGVTEKTPPREVYQPFLQEDRETLEILGVRLQRKRCDVPLDPQITQEGVDCGLHRTLWRARFEAAHRRGGAAQVRSGNRCGAAAWVRCSSRRRRTFWLSTAASYQVKLRSASAAKRPIVCSNARWLSSSYKKT